MEPITVKVVIGDDTYTTTIDTPAIAVNAVLQVAAEKSLTLPSHWGVSVTGPRFPQPATYKGARLYADDIITVTIQT